jgi:hypothetical protein
LLQLDLSYLCLDEFDKASPDVKVAAGALLLGATRVEREGEVRAIRPLIYITLNDRGKLQGLHDAYVRRSVMLDTSPLRHLLMDVDLDMARLFDGSRRIPRLSLERLKPPVTALPRDLWRVLRDELRHGLTEEGWALTDTEPVARIALGRAALTSGDLEQAVFAVALDALCCASTLGHTVAGYSDRLASRLGNGALLPDLNAAEQQQQQLAALHRKRKLEHARDRHRFVEERTRLDQMLHEVINRLDLRRLQDCSTNQRVDARSIAEVLRDIRANITAAQTWQTLSDAEDHARDPVLRAGELLHQIDQDRATRREIQARAAPIQRSRKPELQAFRNAMQLAIDMLPNTHGTALDILAQQTRQLVEQEPPMSEAERRRRTQAFQRREVEITSQVGRHLLDPGTGRRPPYAADA